MKYCRFPRIKTNVGKYSTLIGAFLIMIPIGYSTMWGNISVYVFSYVWRDLGYSSGMQSPWNISIYIIAWNLASYFDGLLRNLDKRLTTVLAILIFNSGILSHWLFLQDQFKEDVLFLLYVSAFLVGVGAGMLICVCSRLVADWQDTDKMGFGFLVFYSGITFGNFLLNPLISLYVNPDNLSPMAVSGHLKHFTDDKVVNKAPSMFLVLGGSFLVIQTIGFLLLRVKTYDHKKGSSGTNNLAYGSTSDGSVPTMDSTCVVKGQVTNKSGRFSIIKESAHEMERGSAEPTISPHQDMPAETTSDREIEQTGNATQNTCNGIDGKSIGISELFKSPALYTLWVVYFCIEFMFIQVSNYYKIYGEYRISDDHFLSDLTISMGIFTCIFLVIWGLVIDRLGVKTSLIIFLTAGVTLPLLSFFVAILDKWLYMFVESMFFCVRTSFTPVFLIAASVYFNKSNISTCFGLITSGMIPANLIAPPLFAFIIGTCGWYSSFATVAILNLLGLITTVLFLPVVKSVDNKSQS